MSRDYGFKCLDCDKSKVPNNLGLYAIYDALKAVHELADLRRSMSAVRSIGCLDVEVTAYWCPDFYELLDWIVEHHEHRLIVVDEYGYEHPEKKRG